MDLQLDYTNNKPYKSYNQIISFISNQQNVRRSHKRENMQEEIT